MLVLLEHGNKNHSHEKVGDISSCRRMTPKARRVTVIKHWWRLCRPFPYVGSAS